MVSETVRGHLFVLVGPGGTGKNTLMNIVKARQPYLKQLATATTRAPRDGELHGREHLFVSLQDFQQMIDENQLLEHQEVTTGKFYGIPRFVVEDNLSTGQSLVADIEFKGAKILHDAFPADVIMIFINVPGHTLEAKLDLLRYRMLNRIDGEPTEEDLARIEERLKRAKESELPFANNQGYIDYEIVNETLDDAANQLEQIIVNTLSLAQKS